MTSRTEVGLNSYHSFHTGSTPASKWTREHCKKETFTARLLLYVYTGYPHPSPPPPPKKNSPDLHQSQEWSLAKVGWTLITTVPVAFYWVRSDDTVHYKSDKMVNFCYFRCATMSPITVFINVVLLANVNSCSCSLYVVVRSSVCRLSSVCLSSVCNVRAPYSADCNFRQCFCAM